jgi:ABC-type uncharacterized transport system permease subunit
VLFATTAALYGLACAFYIALLVRGGDGAGRGGVWALLAAAVAHVAFVATDFATAGHHPLEEIRSSLSLLSLLIVAAYLAATMRWHVKVLGAFVTPVALLFFLGAGLGRGVGDVPHEVRSVLLPVHVGLNVLGLVAFAIAFVAAVAYVIQENLLRQKKITGLFRRLPALDELDTIGLRFVTLGFPLLTLGIITGTVWAVRLDPDAPAISAAQGFALLAWLVFAAVLLLRVAAGWRGRRAAIGTMLGFVCTIAVLAGYVLRDAGAAG